jgi:adenylate kinase family enzyme
MQLILFRGRPGTGKTTMSDLLSAKINVPVIRKDDIYDLVAGLTESHELRNKISHNIIYSILKSNSHNSSTLILDCPFQYENDINSLREWCSNNNVQLKSILVTCSDEKIWAERFKERAKNAAPNQLITDFEEFKSRYKSMHIKPDTGELLLNTIDSPGQNLDTVLGFLELSY